MEYLPQAVPLIILIPSIGAFINLFWGTRLKENGIALVATTASALAFVVAVLLATYLSNSNYVGVVVNPPLFDGWIRLANGTVEIPWQMRVDTLSVTMMLLITGVGTLIHIYSAGYMHGEPRYHRYFAYLNMFLAFMLVLVTGNNLVMLFVGWEGVGLCSFLLIGFWFDRKNVGWRNSLAARKAFILNRIGDFGLMMAIFITFWTFGTVDFYRPGEIANVEAAAHNAELAEADHGADVGTSTEFVAPEAEGEHREEAPAAAEGDQSSTIVLSVQETGGEGADEAEHEEGEAGAAADDHSEGAAVAGDHAEDDAHAAIVEPVYTNNDHIPTDQLGIFGQAERMLEDDEQVDFGPFDLPISSVIGLITFFMLIGAAGKSAQIPLFVWLPDAMAGPTPASALIHAATMVTAGVYMMVRANVLFYEADFISFIVTMVGVGTALVGGFIALGQWDIKRVLAYSTVSQLGFMVAAVGVGAYGAAMFHLITHAFFKALLFLGSGSVIHGVEHGHHHAHAHHDDHADASLGHEDPHGAPKGEHGEEDAGHDDDFDPQDMRNMGGLRRRMPITYVTYVIGTLALAGVFPFAGFWSKDEILADSWLAGIFEGNLGGYIALGGLLAAAAFTAFYMWRQVVLVFHGQPRTDAARNAPESEPRMLIALISLGVLSLFGGFLNTPSGVLGLDGIFGAHRLTTWLEQTVVHAHAADFQPLIALGALALAIGAILLANNVYKTPAAVRAVARGRDPLETMPGIAPVWSIANARMYWDRIYYVLIERPFNVTAHFLADVIDWRFWHDYFHDNIIRDGFNAIGDLLAKIFDTRIIDGAVNGLGSLARYFSGRLRTVQTGYVRTYAIVLLLGVVVVIIVILLPLMNRS